MISSLFHDNFKSRKTIPLFIMVYIFFLSDTLYIGHHVDTGLYALPAIADSSEVNPLVDRGLIVLLDKTSFSVLPYYSGNNYNVEPKNVENHTILLGNI